jgi:glutamyl-tRNA reductase
MRIVVTGVSHDTAPLEVRERIHLHSEQLASVLTGMAGAPHISECVVLSTCNRLEVYAVCSGARGVSAMLAGAFGERVSELKPYTYYHEGVSAVRHLFRVASGVDSLVLGEVQILGQVRRAWQSAHKAGTTGPVLSQLFHKAVALGKRVHSETTISRRPASVSYAAVALAKQIFGEGLRDRRVLVIGTGEVGEGVARCLYEHGLHTTVVAHRQVERARTVARRYHADVILWEHLPQYLVLSDIVISSTAAPHTILQRRQIAEAMQARANRPLYLIDLAVPRDIDPTAAEVPGVHLHNIDDLQNVVHTGLQERQQALPEIEAMIEQETARFSEWLMARSVAPTIQAVRAQADEVVRRETEWALSKLPDLTDRERQIVEALAARVAGKLLHGPIQWLKAQAPHRPEPSYDLSELTSEQLAEMFYGTDEQAPAPGGYLPQESQHTHG